MNWYRGPTSTTEPPAVKPEGAGKKLRRKLQKIGTQQRWYQSKDSNHSEAKKVGASIAKNNKAVLETPDPNDGKWLEQLRKSGQLCRSPPSVAQPNKKPHRHSMQVIPEFAHLGVDEAIPGRPLDKRASCATPSSISSVRRHAKTPVRFVGQLENWPGRDQPVARKVSSVERIAESYRALLESSCAILNDTAQEPLPLRLGKSSLTETKNHVGRDTMQEIPELPIVMGSPHSDDGTLVAFEEDTVSFKPGSVSSEPSSPWEGGREHEHHRHEQRRALIPPRRASPAGSPSLQICLDLLGRELSSAASGSSLRPSAETSALQVWVLIEAYERLRDQVLGMHLDRDQERSLNAMLDTWIKALYAVHDKMTGCDGRVSESEYGD
ncbi:hypothetical protein F4818DRAFT_264624 [Hypoxylon cercidicola]|nr:hypothetical protein F4818DRAFT_264624 [Hypoxylon cercidicola]